MQAAHLDFSTYGQRVRDIEIAANYAEIGSASVETRVSVERDYFSRRHDGKAFSTALRCGG